MHKQITPKVNLSQMTVSLVVVAFVNENVRLFFKMGKWTPQK